MLHMMQDENGTAFLRKFLHGDFELYFEIEIFVGVHFRQVFRPVKIDLLYLLFPVAVNNEIFCDSEQIRLDRLFGIDPLAILPQPLENILNDFLGYFRTLDPADRVMKQHRIVTEIKNLKRLLVGFLNRACQFVIGSCVHSGVILGKYRSVFMGEFYEP